MQPSNRIEYSLIRTRRKTIALMFNSEGKLVVRAPLRASERSIKAFIEEKSAWIYKKQAEISERNSRYQSVSVETGSEFYYLGDEFVIQPGESRRFSFSGNTLLVPKNTTLNKFAAWMKSEARALITERVELYAAQMQVSYASIKMSSARKRWGSCGASNSLNFSWRLIMCPLWIIDYVVVHELAHTLVKDHGSRYWSYVAEHYPRYKEARAWLRANSGLMRVI